METLLVAAKTFENEQIGEKVRTKMRLRVEKGLWNGGLVPFGFVREPDTQMLLPDPEKKSIVQQVFKVYVESASDCVVRDWLKAHQIPAPGGKPVWAKGTIRDLLCNRRYIAEIEVNKQNKGFEDLRSQTLIILCHYPMSRWYHENCSSWRKRSAKRRR
jgi:DNA invertase Pin-like site-specific DNA recombinase